MAGEFGSLVSFTKNLPECSRPRLCGGAISTESRIDIIAKIAYESQFVNQQSLRPIAELVEWPQPPVFECHDAIEAAGEIEVVRCDQCREPGMTDEIEEGAEDALAGRVIEVTGTDSVWPSACLSPFASGG